MTTVHIKLQRHDREPDGDHVYGTKIDKLIGAAVGGAAKCDRTQYTPAAPVSGTNARLESIAIWEAIDQDKRSQVRLLMLRRHTSIDLTPIGETM